MVGGYDGRACGLFIRGAQCVNPPSLSHGRFGLINDGEKWNMEEKIDEKV